MLVFFRGKPDRNDRGDNLPSLVIAMFVFALVFPGLLILLTRSQQLSTTSPDYDEGIQARAELAELFGSVDPIGSCASPEGGPEAAFRDTCFREQLTAGASLIRTPSLPASSPHPDAATCWLTVQENNKRQRKCLVLEGDHDELECDPTNTTCLRVLSEVTGEPVAVDKHGGGLLIIRSWDEEDADDCFQREYQDLTGVPLTDDVPDVPFLPYHECFVLAQNPDRIIYRDVEWSCVRWRHSYDADFDRDGDTDDLGEWAAYQWLGGCPDPADPPKPVAPSNPAVQTEPWPRDLSNWPAVADARLPRRATGEPVIQNLQLYYEHTLGDPITGVEIQVCVASSYADRLQGKPHCSVDRMRFNVADGDGGQPPVPLVPAVVPHPHVVANGLTVTENDSGGFSFPMKLLVPPSAPVIVTIAAPPGVTVTTPPPHTSPPTLTFTPDNWDIPQTVTVAGDDEPPGDRSDNIVTLTLTTASAGDSDYDSLNPLDIEVTIVDDDIPSLRTEPGSVTVAENSTNTFTVQLGAVSGEVVTVAVASADPAAVTILPASLIFPPGGGNTPQTVTVIGVDDADGNDETTNITLTASSADGGYNNLTASVSVTVADDDTPALTLTADSVTVNENGTGTVDVSLATQPTGSVTVTVASADPTAATVAPTSLTFSTTNWATPQTITVAGEDDADSSDETTAITLTGSNGGYDTVTETVTVTVTDDDLPLFTAAEAESYVEARDCLVQGMSHSASDHGSSTYANNYRNEADTWCSTHYLTNQGLSTLNPLIPLGQDDPNDLPAPSGTQGQNDLRDAIDALAVAAGLTQDQIDAAEGG